MERSAARVQPSSKNVQPRSTLPSSNLLEAEHEHLPVNRLSRQAVHGANVVALQRVIGNRATQRLLRQTVTAEHKASRSAPSISSDIVPEGMLQLVRIEGVPAVESQVTKVGPFVTDVDLNCGWYCLQSALQYSITKLGLTHLAPPDILAPKTTKRAYAPHVNAMEYVTHVKQDPKDMAEWENLLSEHGPLMIARDLAIPLIGHFVLIVGIDSETEEVEFFDPLSASKPHFMSFKKFQKVMRPGRTSYVDEKALKQKNELERLVAEKQEKESATGEKESDENLKAEIESD